MCANYTPSRKEQIEDRFGVRSPQLDLPPEAWPGYMAPILRRSHEAPGELEIVPAMFGIVQHGEDLKLAGQTYYARTESVASQDSFRNAWMHKQFCIIPAANFFEFSYETGKPVRWRVELADGGLLAIAGIWEFRQVDQLLSFAMLTISADRYPLMRRFHKPNDEKRMVMMLTQEQCKAWLEGSLVSGKDIYRQYHAEHLVAQYDPLLPRAGAKEAYEAAETPPDSLF